VITATGGVDTMGDLETPRVMFCVGLAEHQ
jgi:hypothetical protein